MRKNKAVTEEIEEITDTEAEDDTEYWLCGTGIPDGPDYTGGVCKVIQDEGNEKRSCSYEEYIENREISETDNVAGIYMALTVKNGKVTEIYYSS